MIYSCAYFQTGEESIDAAQEAKLDHICRKLRLQPGERFLDIGCGWGGLIVHAAQRYGVRAVGITLSDNQFALARKRVRETGLQQHVEVLRLDYRDTPERFGAGTFTRFRASECLSMSARTISPLLRNCPATPAIADYF